MAVVTVSYNATITLGMSLLKISQPSGHKIDELGFFKAWLFKPRPHSWSVTFNYRGKGLTLHKVGHFGYLFKLKLCLICQKIGPMLTFFGLFLSDFILFCVFQYSKNYFDHQLTVLCYIFHENRYFLYNNTSFFFPNSIKKAILGLNCLFKAFFHSKKHLFLPVSDPKY